MFGVMPVVFILLLLVSIFTEKDDKYFEVEFEEVFENER